MCVCACPSARQPMMMVMVMMMMMMIPAPYLTAGEIPLAPRIVLLSAERTETFRSVHGGSTLQSFRVVWGNEGDMSSQPWLPVLLSGHVHVLSCRAVFALDVEHALAM